MANKELNINDIIDYTNELENRLNSFNNYAEELEDRLNNAERIIDYIDEIITKSTVSNATAFRRLNPTC